MLTLLTLQSFISKFLSDIIFFFFFQSRWGAKESSWDAVQWESLLLNGKHRNAGKKFDGKENKQKIIEITNDNNNNSDNDKKKLK